MQPGLTLSAAQEGSLQAENTAPSLKLTAQKPRPKSAASPLAGAQTRGRRPGPLGRTPPPPPGVASEENRGERRAQVVRLNLSGLGSFCCL